MTRHAPTFGGGEARRWVRCTCGWHWEYAQRAKVLRAFDRHQTNEGVPALLALR
jgi:hypothetical protein